ncbi:hypothetical protein IQ241_00015 [Romeria aff. gracilis LEGE 07310]|uniref:Uncharacterized protein n=1 Tax=Vasconcelosia minhoensis LEGE 07310 TaxID=915328 RepID=A0A8J7D9T7_9CYAN|nr:hypothetical protein [Romeria gracilis]MBE9075697.1 hypothetical protein [Romeria aff. gracilis LEGE 07310]
MLKRLRAFFSFRPDRLVIRSKGQQTCGVSRAQIRAVIEWLGLRATDYGAMAHLIWDNPEIAIADLDARVKDGLQRKQPIFLYRCGDRPSVTPPAGYDWRLVPEYPSLRLYRLEKDE